MRGKKEDPPLMGCAANSQGKMHKYYHQYGGLRRGRVEYFQFIYVYITREEEVERWSEGDVVGILAEGTGRAQRRQDVRV